MENKEDKKGTKEERKGSLLLCVILFIIALVNFGLVLYATKDLPDSVPVHAGFNMMVDRWGSPAIIKFFGAFPALMLILFGFMQHFAGGTGTNRKLINSIIAMTTVMLLCCTWMSVFMASKYESAALGQPLPVSMILLVILPISFILIFTGNYSARIKQNRWLGIRTKDTFADEKVWKKTHRMAGFFMFFAGIILAVLGIIGAVTNNSVWVLAGLGITIISVFIPVIYANKLNKTISKE